MGVCPVATGNPGRDSKEVDILLSDFIERQKQLLFNSLLYAYYVGFIPMQFNCRCEYTALITRTHAHTHTHTHTNPNTLSHVHTSAHTTCTHTHTQHTHTDTHTHTYTHTHTHTHAHTRTHAHTHTHTSLIPRLCVRRKDSLLLIACACATIPRISP